MGKAVNKRELSEILGISERSLTDWQGEGMPIQEMGTRRGQEHTYDTEVVIRWWMEREVKRRTSGSSEDKLNDVKYQREVLALKRDLGELVEADKIRPALESWRDEVLATLVGIPEKYAQRLEITAGVDAKREALSELVEELREVMGSYDGSTGAGTAGGAGLPQPAEDQRIAVG